MAEKTFSRRKFLKLAGLSLGALAFRPQMDAASSSLQPRLMRVCDDESVSIHKQPNDESIILYQRLTDDLINVFYEVESEYGPEYNPIWYRVWGGYVHRAKLYEVKYILNPVADSIHEDGQLGEITVPYTQALGYTPHMGWEEVCRLYYQSMHWIRDIITGPDNQPWYELEDELDRDQPLAIPAKHMRIVKDSEFDPIHPDVPASSKWIEISIYRQELTAYEGDTIVLQTKISSGLPYYDMGTPTGEFRIGSKMPSKHMGEEITNDIHAYLLMGVPWCSFFETENGVALHGTYWHNNFGAQMSHGCVNMRNEDAKWIFRWSTPVANPHKYDNTGSGTRVLVV